MKIHLNNVGIINKCDVEFIPGINLIIGSSGSGKSTLMRCLYNMAVNEFSDSDISFGHNTMKVKIINDDNNVIEYNRSIKTKNDKCCYIVNGERYTKLGRQPLKAVSDTLKIGDIDINGESINFNFNLQFSSPFLILGSQSTLYNVLTYRSTFDISSINDYYMADVKNNSYKIATNEKLKEQLESNLNTLENQLEHLAPIENLYSDYIAYKHKLCIVNELNKLYNLLAYYKKITDLVFAIDPLINNINKSLNNITIINNLYSYKNNINNYNTFVSNINYITNIIKLNECAANKFQLLYDVSKLIVMRKSLNICNNNYYYICSNITLLEKLLLNEQFTIDLLKQKNILLELDRCNKFINLVHNLSNYNINAISDLLMLDDKLLQFININKIIKETKRKCTITNNKLAKFGVCPLCGNHLEIKEEIID